MNKKHFWMIIRAFAIFISVLAYTGCGSTPKKESPVSAGSGIESLGDVDKELYRQSIESMTSGKYNVAEKDLKILLTRRQDVKDVWANYALTLYHQKKTEELLSAINSVKSKGMDVVPIYNLEGMVAIEKGEFAKAEVAFSKALSLDDAYANAWFNMGLLQDVYLQNVNKAIECYTRYLKLNPEDEDTKNWLSHLQESAGK